MNLGKALELVLEADAKEKATHNVVWNSEVSQATRMHIDALLLKCRIALKSPVGDFSPVGLQRGEQNED